MDKTLNSASIRAGDRERRAFRARFVLGYLISYSIDSLLLVLFVVAGTIPHWIPIAYLAAGLAVGSVFGLLMLSGASERYTDPYVSVWQTLASGACLVVFLALAPEVGALFLCVLFIVFGFGSLRMSWREALLSYGLIALATSAVLYNISGTTILPYSTPLERLLVWVGFILTLARLTLLGLVGSMLRIQVVKAYRQSKALISELENRTAELVEAKAAADAANQARFESERMRTEEALHESEGRLRLALEAAHMGTFDWDMVQNRLIWSLEHEVLFGYAPGEFDGTAEALEERTHPADLPGVKAEIARCIAARTPFEYEFRVLWPDGSEHWVASLGEFRFSGADQAVRMCGVTMEVTERKRAEKRLRDTLAEKEVLMREIHHRVKNNLQMMSALLELQSGYVQDEKVRAYFTNSQQRIQSMAMIHAQLYEKQDLAQINFSAYLQSLVDSLRAQYSERCENVAIRVNAQACALPLDSAIPLGLVLNELVSNAMKHAFPGGRAGELRIGLRCGDGGEIVLEVADNGVGLPAEPESRREVGFGMRVIRLMVEKQLHGKLRIESDHGTRVSCEIGTRQ